MVVLELYYIVNHWLAKQTILAKSTCSMEFATKSIAYLLFSENGVPRNIYSSNMCNTLTRMPTFSLAYRLLAEHWMSCAYRIFVPVSNSG